VPGSGEVKFFNLSQLRVNLIVIFLKTKEEKLSKEEEEKS